MAAQLAFIEVTPDSAHWLREGCACEHCAEGRMYMAAPSDPCSCKESSCICLAEGYAKCDSCGALRQVWPREMSADWQVLGQAS